MAHVVSATRCSFPLIIACILVLGSTPAAADVYRWVDEHGQVHYGDRPQHAGEAPVRVKPSPPAADERLEQRRQRRDRLLRIFAEDRERQQAEAQRQAEAQAARLRACQRARDALRNLERGGRFYELDPAGERRYLGDPEIQGRKKHWRAELRQQCEGL